MVSSKTRSNSGPPSEPEESALFLALAFLLLLRPFSRADLAPPPALLSWSLPLLPPLPKRPLLAPLLPPLPRRALLAPLLPPLPLRLPSLTPPLLAPALGRGVPSGIRRCGVKPPSFGRDQEQKAANRALSG